MNKYGMQAQKAWQQASPTHYSQIPDQDEFFTQLGEQAAEQIAELQTKLAGPDPAGESYFEKVGRLNAAKNQAEEIVSHDLLAPPATEEDEENVNPELQQYLDWKAEAEDLRRQL
ncbi:outer membrane protein assembly factor BamD (BamD/ComL family) [Arthrobacter pascens]|uniref:TnpV protein n=1 Tax=Arthrobacter pascens TaxID=1677 RepID=UPI00277E42E0|nr:TnpV protein [Arthrobacter pascens]MDQ0636377.1 outer membrane protein assembly factor BamD (BamD/ComL family) [Arthrobacter pascens]